MISRLRGAPVGRTPEGLVVEVGGVGDGGRDEEVVRVAGEVAEVDGTGLEDVGAGCRVGKAGVGDRAGAGAPVVGLGGAGEPALEAEPADVAG